MGGLLFLYFFQVCLGLLFRLFYLFPPFRCVYHVSIMLRMLSAQFIIISPFSFSVSFFLPESLLQMDS
ncbi:hypothetical protein QBC37DRAFT_413544 [Rhypophila decipiens]|uniref:Uncharacterized protein n=1 Tax=Rhypophila decipiens TaxID=261697 RepID=A0AAN6YGA0_9PEZI|nr:hypothetical protein QBC37DRAFT_413544 [Rhypophila decipiens]